MGKIKVDEMIVAFSGGKDALATLDVCARQFKKIKVFFMFWVRGLRFQEVVLQAAERRYGIEILRIPHFMLPSILTEQIFTVYRASYPEFRYVSQREFQDYVRGKFGIPWIAQGEKMCDSFTRRFMMRSSGQWDWKRGMYYPLMYWTHTQVFQYLKFHHIQPPPEYQYMRESWGGIEGRELYQVKKYFPEDYKRILAVFPFAEAIERNYELYRKDREKEAKRRIGPTGKNRPAEIPDADNAALGIKTGSVQPPPD